MGGVAVWTSCRMGERLAYFSQARRRVTERVRWLPSRGQFEVWWRWEKLERGQKTTREIVQQGVGLLEGKKPGA